jgi:hypothetical protein
MKLSEGCKRCEPVFFCPFARAAQALCLCSLPPSPTRSPLRKHLHAFPHPHISSPQLRPSLIFSSWLVPQPGRAQDLMLRNAPRDPFRIDGSRAWSSMSDAYITEPGGTSPNFLHSHEKKVTYPWPRIPLVVLPVFFYPIPCFNPIDHFISWRCRLGARFLVGFDCGLLPSPGFR